MNSKDTTPAVKGGIISQSEAKPTSRPLGFARHILSITSVFIIITVSFLSFYIGLQMRDAILAKQKASSTILADYLDNQILRRFTNPTAEIFGFIRLEMPAQYRQLDIVVKATIDGLGVDRVRIFSLEGEVAYSTVVGEAGRLGLASEKTLQAKDLESPIFVIDRNIPYWKVLFSLPLEPDCFVLRTTFPLRSHITDTGEARVMGVLEITQDISKDIEDVFRMQIALFILSFISIAVLLLLLFVFIRRAERALSLQMHEEARLTEELHQHEKLAGMGRVIASIAHEIRNPLGIIQSSAELLLNRAQNSDEVTRNILQAIYDEAKRLSQTVRDFLDYARPQVAKQTPVPIKKVIDQALAFLATELHSANIDILFNTQLDKSYLVKGDSDFLYRMVFNIIANAIQSIGQDGTIIITLLQVKNTITLSFHDSGIGFPEEDIPRLLDPFVTTKDDGTGLGLAIVNNIITSHGGILELKNAPEGGAIISITLPRA